MQINRQPALDYIDTDEGFAININVHEPGGISAHGVTLALLADYNKEMGLPKPDAQDIRLMTKEQAGKIFTWAFLDPLRFDELPSGIDYRMADAAITLGLRGSCVALQMALLVYPVSGIMDDKTIATIKATNPGLIIAALNAAWITWKHGIATEERWQLLQHGWINRCIKVRDRALKML